MSGCLVFAVLALAAPALKDAGIVGSWRLESLTASGKAERIGPKAVILIFASDGRFYSGTEGEKQPPEFGTYTLDTKADPMTIDVDGSKAGLKKWNGIIKVDGDTLTLCCIPMGDAPRPTAFESPKDTFHLLSVLKRVKKKD